MRAVLRLACVVCTALYAVTPVFGQTPGSETPPVVPTASPDLPVPPGAGWVFTPGMTLAAMYDSNVALRSAPASTNRTEDDIVFTMNPSGNLRYSGKYTDLSGSYRGRFRRYMDLDQLNGFDQRATLSVRHRATRHFTVFGSNNYTLAPSTDEIDLAGVPYVRIGSRSDRANAGFTLQTSDRIHVGARYDFTWVEFDRPELPGGVINGLSGDVTTSLGPRLRAGGETSIRFAEIGDNDRNLRFVDAGGLLNYELTRHTKLGFAGGVGTLTDRLTGRSEVGPYVRASVSTVTEDTVMGASFERSFIPAYGFGGSARSQQARGWVDLPRVARRTSAQFALTWLRNDPLEAANIQTDHIQARATIGYLLAQRIRVQGFYAFTRQDSITVGGEINRSRIGVDLVLFQPMRIR